MVKLHNGRFAQERVQTLQSDCQACCGLCCIAFYRAQAEGFPADQAPGEACGNLREDFHCAVHEQLATKKLKGCMAFECMSAGQRTTRLFGAANWRDQPAQAQQMYQTFLLIWRLQQIKWYLAEAADLLPAQCMWPQLEALIAENDGYSAAKPKELEQLDIAAYQTRANGYLKQAWALTQQALGSRKPPKHTVDNIGKNFKGTNLSGRDFSMALCIAADLSCCDLTGANLLGADLRDCQLSGSDLRECLFLTQSQLNAARGDHTTHLPEQLSYPLTWR